MHFDLIQSISLAGDASVPNDDRAGMSPRHAWVIDGATDLGPPGLVGAQGGAAWLSGVANAAYHAAPTTSVAAIHAAVSARILDAYATARTREPEGRWELPVAASLAVWLGEGVIEAAWLGDCVGLLRTASGVARIGTVPDSREAETEYAASLAQHGLGSVKRGAAPLVAELRASRNRPGSRILGPDPELMANPNSARVTCAPGDELLLMTDGYSALVDGYGLLDDAALVDAVARDGLAAVAERLRALECEDSACTRYPRFKISDDATALWLRIGG